MRKTFDAVKFQRKVREELSKRYLKNPRDFCRELKEAAIHCRPRRLAAR